MIDMLKFFNIKLTGKHHSDIDDTRGITKILLHMIKDGQHDYKFNYVKYVGLFHILYCRKKLLF